MTAIGNTESQVSDAVSQFWITIGDVCDSASLASLTVEITTEDGQRHRGIPSPVIPRGADAEASGPGRGDLVEIGGGAVPVTSIVRICLGISP